MLSKFVLQSSHHWLLNHCTLIT